MEKWFISNKYSEWYFSLIEKAKLHPPDGYCEKHHVIPRSLNGSDDSSNLVKLSPRLHFICHWLLVKMTTGTSYRKMLHALVNMRMCSKTQKRIISGWQYDVCRRANSESSKLRVGYSSKKKGRTYGKQKNKFKGSPAKWWNNGFEEIKSYQCPEGWTRGRISKTWWNNGVEQKLSILPPSSDWIKGRMDLKGRSQSDEHRIKRLESLRDFYSRRSQNNI